MKALKESAELLSIESRSSEVNLEIYLHDIMINLLILLDTKVLFKYED